MRDEDFFKFIKALLTEIEKRRSILLVTDYALHLRSNAHIHRDMGARRRQKPSRNDIQQTNRDFQLP